MVSPSEPDYTERLVRAARERPSEGFAELYRRVAPAVVVWSRMHVHEGLRARLDPEDVLLETLVRAWQRFDQFDPARSTFRNWLFGIARNVLLEAFRKLSSSSATSTPVTGLTLSLVPDTATSITRDVARRESLLEFAARVRALPREDQRLLLYRGLEERTHEEVGQLLNVSPEAAAKRWQRLRAELLDDPKSDDFLAA
jgi:RNA polymerase sigma-70 factor (ECF subfamily)